MRLRVNVISAVLVLAVTMLVFQACSSGGGNSNDNSNDNSNSNANDNSNSNANDNSNTNSNLGKVTNKASADQPSVVLSICATFADKLKLKCEESQASISDWHKKALTDKQDFMDSCAGQPIFKTGASLSPLQTEINNANSCADLLAIEFD